ncbi:MAG: hypothetical protein JWO08_3468 [Verrucomicrobiaceae bacterium]|nr:hypothetical protein [Verrucomicrobiaceae bacterium]
MNTQTTLVTGASSGIGMHLAHEFARHGHPLILVAPVESELETVAAHMRQAHGVNVHVIAKDLEKPESAQEIFEEVQAQGLEVQILVNNAGHGYRGKTWELPIEKDLSMIRLNIEAPLRLTKLFLPLMVQRQSGSILNTASIAGFEPGPMLNVYHSTKAFLLSWSEALAHELSDTPVTVTALCPGPTDTDFFPKADMEGARAFQEASLMAPQEVAKAGYEGLMERKLFVVPGAMNKALVASRRILSESAQASINAKFYEEVPAEKQTRERGDIESPAKS